MLRNKISMAVLLAISLFAMVSSPFTLADTVDNPGDFVITATSGYIKVGTQQFNINPDSPPSIGGSVDTDGIVTIPISGIEFPDTVISVPLIGDITVRMEPQGDAMGALNPITGEANFSISLKVRLINSLLGSNCGIGPINAIMTTGSSGSLVGVLYDQSLGTATYVNNEFGVPRSSGCGLFGSIIDSFARLPSNPPNNEILLNVQYDPIITGS
ncbi:MAG: hypothetical protein HYR55_08435 [Acidobacteria bacterium]|nr:hypothetical protein [Acidobacteriota bacterium]MBI3658409.1 hypothetical protein [Acidobacteriota bacterium]